MRNDTRGMDGNDHRLRLAFRSLDYHETQARIVRRAVEEASPGEELKPSALLPGDARRLRGIPCVGVLGGMGGAILGSRPGSGRAFRD